MAAESNYHALKSLGDIKTIRDLTEDNIRDILRRHTKDGSLTIVEFGALEDMLGNNDAINSTVCRQRVVARTHGADKEFNFVIKAPPKMSFIRASHRLTRPFCNEVTFYVELIAQLELANGKGTLDDILPVCYHAYSSYYADDGDSSWKKKCPWFCCLLCEPAEDGIIILENIKMREKRYTMFDKRSPLPLDHVLMIMRQLAAFHGKWLRWKWLAQTGGLPADKAWSWAAFQRAFNTQKRVPRCVYKQLSNAAKRTVINVLKHKGDEQANVAKCRRFFDRTAMAWMAEYLSRDDRTINTLCHGDFWSNNIMFSYDEAGSPTDLIIIDYQLLNYGHPAYDLVYFFYLNTDLAFRNSHLEQALRVYHTELAGYVAANTPEGFVYPFEDFKVDFDWHRSVGFVTACAVMPNVMSSVAIDLEGSGCCALRDLQRKQTEELEDDSNAAGVETRRRILDLVHEMARDGVI